MTYEIEICGNINLAGRNISELERLSYKQFETEAEAEKAVNALAADWHNPSAIWDMVSVIEN